MRFGVGLVVVAGEPPRIEAEGRYGLDLSFGGVRLEEQDSVGVSINVKRNRPVGFMGLGWERPLTGKARLVVGIDVEALPRRLTTSVSATPRRATGFNVILIRGVNPALYISGSQESLSTLSMPLSEFVTFSSAGIDIRIRGSIGVSFSF